MSAGRRRDGIRGVQRESEVAEVNEMQTSVESGVKRPAVNKRKTNARTNTPEMPRIK